MKLKLQLQFADATDLPKNDWFTIEKAEHSHSEQAVKDGPNSEFWYDSSRLCDADIEGTIFEMSLLAGAILKRQRFESKRCAVDARRCLGEEVYLWSPRNSKMRGVVSYDEAIDLTNQIQKELSEQ